MNDKLWVLVICTGNSTRSQMAEGLFRRLGGERVDVFGAGSDPAPAVHPLAQVGASVARKLSEKRLEFLLTLPYIYVGLKLIGVFKWPGLRL